MNRKTDRHKKKFQKNLTLGGVNFTLGGKKIDLFIVVFFSFIHLRVYISEGRGTSITVNTEIQP